MKIKTLFRADVHRQEIPFSSLEGVRVGNAQDDAEYLSHCLALPVK